MTLTSFDHMIFITDDLEATSAAFADAGFSIVTRADRDEGPSANRLAVFEDGSYLEILCFVDPEYGARHQLRPLLDAAGPVWGDWSLLMTDMDGWIAKFEAAGLPYVAAPDYGKALADGRDWSLRLVKTGRGVKHAELPFLIQDKTDHALRVPDAVTGHANGATGIAGVTILSPDIEAVSPAFDMLMPESEALPAPEGAVAARRWCFGERFVTLVQPAATGALAKRLALRGPSILTLHLAGGDASVGMPFDLQLDATALSA